MDELVREDGSGGFEAAQIAFSSRRMASIFSRRESGTGGSLRIPWMIVSTLGFSEVLSSPVESVCANSRKESNKDLEGNSKVILTQKYGRLTKNKVGSCLHRYVFHG